LAQLLLGLQSQCFFDVKARFAQQQMQRLNPLLILEELQYFVL
jgi:hypothetical protein